MSGYENRPINGDEQCSRMNIKASFVYSLASRLCDDAGSSGILTAPLHEVNAVGWLCKSDLQTVEIHHSMQPDYCRNLTITVNGRDELGLHASQRLHLVFYANKTLDLTTSGVTNYIESMPRLNTDNSEFDALVNLDPELDELFKSYACIGRPLTLYDIESMHEIVAIVGT